MWIGGVDVPRELVDAHQRGGLVVFVGAGASVDPPSSLPMFVWLTENIFANSPLDLPPNYHDRPDAALGLLDDLPNVDVHQQVKAKIDVPGSEPNRLHHAIAALAGSVPPVRIVTTNYDLHLSTALAQAGHKVTEYDAPALPVGDDFTGLVYLHGALRQDPRHLVATDVDFGRAYLRDAWATRFLERMFAEFVVLFIGYSHNDVVMTYLARGLPRAKGRYVLVDTPDDRRWQSLGITPIGYEVVDGSHAALGNAIAGWSAQTSMRLTEHRQRIADLVAELPSRIPDEVSYLEMVLGDEDKVGFFAEHARGKEWLEWAASRDEFTRLFDPNQKPVPSSGPLAYWFAEYFVMNEELTAAARSVLEARGGRLAPTVWFAIGQVLHRRKGPRPTWLNPWVAILIEQAPAFTNEWLDYALVASTNWPNDHAAAVLLFEHLTEPVLGRSSSRIELRGTEHWLTTAWETIFVPRLEFVVHDVLPIVTSHLVRAYRLLTLAGENDVLTFRRTAIEPNEQDQPLRQPIDLLVDAARDCIEYLLASEPTVAASHLAAWTTSPYLLLRRLAVYGWTHRVDASPDEKLRWLIGLPWCWDYRVRHEAFQLIAATVGHASPNVANELVSAALAQHPDHGEARPYTIYNALVWIVRHAPTLDSARQALAEISAEHPEYEERDEPDITMRWFAEWGSPQPPISPEQLHELLSKPSIDGPLPTNDMDEVVHNTLKQWPQDGFTILDVQPLFTAAVIRGWADAELDSDTAEAILERLKSTDLADPVVLRAVADLLASGERWAEMPSARALASKAWDAAENEGPATSDNWLGWAINEPAGQLVRFWLNVVATSWRRAGESWSGLPSDLREDLDRLLTSGDSRVMAAEIVLASQLAFFHAADRTWCEDTVLPLLDWADAIRARRTWDGYLTWGRWNEALLAAGLRQHYLQALPRLREFDDQTQGALLQHLASVALRSERNPYEDDWIIQLTIALDRVDATAEWLQRVAWLSAELPTEAVEAEWRRWMKRYWEERLSSVPLTLGDDEASALAEWAVHLGESIAEAVELVVRHPAYLRPHSDLLRQLNNGAIARTPHAVVILVAHLLGGTQLPFYGCSDLEEVVTQLHETPASAGLGELINQAVRLGCVSATDW